jgi:hypothetical protein
MPADVPASNHLKAETSAAISMKYEKTAHPFPALR